MIFQTLDDKKECVGVYYNERLHSEISDNLTKTWAYASYLDGKDIQYASLLCSSDSPGAPCPDHLKDQWDYISDKLKSFLRSFKEAKVDLNQNCFFDLVPERFLLEFCDVKNKITQYVFDKYEKPSNYDFLLSLQRVISEIDYQKMNIDLTPMNRKAYQFKTKQIRQRIKEKAPYIKYDIFGTKTGRLTTKKWSFPILTLAKEYRGVIKPTNDWFVELDFNAAELRTLLALSGQPQPIEDIHQWNAKNIYKNNPTRDEAKKRIFAWLYNPDSKDRSSSKIYNRDFVLKKHWNGEQVHTFYDRIIDADAHHALNYIIQSTTSDMFLRRMVKVHEFLRDKQSNIAFSIHDSLVIDLVDAEKHLIPEIKEIFSKTELGDFKVNISAGKDFGNMKELKI